LGAAFLQAGPQVAFVDMPDDLLKARGWLIARPAADE
jgi:hypothetical protein